MINKMTNMMAFALIFSVIFMIAPDSNAEDAYFIYPANKTVVIVSKIRIIGKAGGDRSPSLYVENRAGKSTYGLTRVDMYFHVEVQLTKGKNILALSSISGTSDIMEIILADDHLSSPVPEDFSHYYIHRNNRLTGECELCHLLGESNIPQFKKVVQQLTCITASCHPNFKQGEFLHGQFEKGLCVKCHNPHGSKNENFLKQSESILCFSCHTDAESMVMEGKYVHYPVRKGECTSCHDPHKSDLEHHLKRENMVGLCSGCHGTGYTSYEVLHDPLTSGDCTVCHVPHVSKHRRLLVQEGNALCFTCHKIRKDEFDCIHVHEPAAKDCTSCHDPHGSASENHLRSALDENGNYVSVTQPIRELCLDCHRKLDPEVVDQIENGECQHEPVAKGECTVCHTPHSTDYKKQLRGPLSEICYSCHPKMKELITSSMYKHGPIRTNDCAQCHLVHGSSLKYLLRNTFSTKFAEEFNIENFTLCFNCHNPEIVLDRKTEVTNFRNGTNNLHYFHVNRKKKGRNCKTCHNIHASDQENHIREKIPFSRRFSIKIEYTKTETGGGCVVGCHKPRKYDRQKPETNK